MFKFKLPISINLSNSFFNSNKIINPRRDWKVLVIFFIIMILASIIFDAYFYNKVASGDMYVSISKEELTLENLKINELKKIVQDFEVRKNTVENLKAERLIDPSI